MIPASRVTQALCHQKVFLERYPHLFKRALYITNSNRELAEDLVQEAFVLFTHSRPNLSDIVSLDSYLYGVLRNLRLSHLRQTTRHRLEQLSFAADRSFADRRLVIDPRPQIQVQDILRDVCRYACWRKETSISGSILLLRFFHGYFPSEVAKVVRSSRNAVAVWLMSARRESQLFLADPDWPGFSDRNQTAGRAGSDEAPGAPDIFTELRHEIFAARRGECLRPEYFHAIYHTSAGGVPRAALSHLVSCPCCLDAANQLLDLPPLHARHPIDVLSKEYEGAGESAAA